MSHYSYSHHYYYYCSYYHVYRYLSILFILLYKHFHHLSSQIVNWALARRRGWSLHNPAGPHLKPTQIPGVLPEASPRSLFFFFFKAKNPPTNPPGHQGVSSEFGSLRMNLDEFGISGVSRMRFPVRPLRLIWGHLTRTRATRSHRCPHTSHRFKGQFFAFLQGQCLLICRCFITKDTKDTKEKNESNSSFCNIQVRLCLVLYDKTLLLSPSISSKQPGFCRPLSIIWASHIDLRQQLFYPCVDHKSSAGVSHRVT